MSRFLLSRLRARGRASAIILSFFAVVAAPQSWGLGLGEIELNSALNQEFSATIELFDAAGLEPGEILVSLGSSEDFDRVGVERFFFLTTLDFQVAAGANGEPQIVVTSRRPITEPYLNFLVEVLWPNGRLLKEYTVLLDPPTFSEAAAPAVAAPAQDRTAANTGRVQRVEPAAGTRVQMTPRAAEATEPSALDRGLAGDEYGMTDRDDTLWTIASRARPSRSVSVQQTMLAIAEMNPDAFINGNINLLKAGYVLKLPNESQIRTRSEQEALGEVARHDEEWRAYSRGEMIADSSTAQRRPAASTADRTSDLRSPVDASAATTAADRAPATEGELRIVAEAGDSTTGVGGEMASGQLAAALEETDKLGLQVEELTYALEHEKQLASDQIAVRDRQLEVKDQQIAELQAQLAAAQAAAQQTPAQPGQPEQTQNQNQSTQAEAAPWWQSSMVMYGGAGVLVLLLVGGMIAQRKRRAAEEENDYFDAEAAYAEEERHEPAVAAFDEADEDEAEEEYDTGSAELAEEEDEEEVQGSQTSDVIGEADIYIAYGRYAQAIGLLQGVLEDEPERNDVRLKLLEVYAESGDRAAFDQHMTSLIEYCDDEEALLTARELESQFGEEAITLDEMMADTGSEAITAEAPQDDTLDLDEDSLEPVAAGIEDVEAVEEAAEDDGALDFELELDELDTETADAEEETYGEVDLEEDETLKGAGDELGGDLGMDFDPESDASELEDTEAEADSPIEFDTSDIELPKDNVDEQAEKPAASGFAETEELTIDSDLEKAAATISGEAAEFDAGADLEGALEADEDLAVETLLDEDEEPLDELELETSVQADEEFEFEDEGDSANTKLDLARAYIDMGDADGARDILKEVLDEGNSDQQQKAQAMLESL